MEGVLQAPIGFCADSSHYVEMHAFLYLPLACVVLVPQEDFLLGQLVYSLPLLHLLGGAAYLTPTQYHFCGSVWQPL